MPYFDIAEEVREILVGQLVRAQPQQDRRRIKEQLTSLVNKFEGRDADALHVLLVARAQGKLNQYVACLNAYYERELCHFPPHHRRDAAMLCATKAELFFHDCYNELGVPDMYRRLLRHIG